jgi:hypothetical protein
VTTPTGATGSVGARTTSPMLDNFGEILADRPGPCLSIYLPTGRRFPEKQQDVVRFRNLLVEIERSLPAELSEDARAELLAPLHELAGNERFWNFTQDGLAVLRASDFYKIWKLQRTVPERAVVADSFHTKPLLRIVQSADRFELLALTREQVRLFQGNRDALDEVELHPDVPRTLTEALGEQLTEQHETAASVGKAGHDLGNVSMRFGVGGRKDELDKDTERFFRTVDRAIFDHHSRSSGLPLLLAALAEYHATFRDVSHNPQLQDEAISGNPNAWSPDELRQKAWQLFEPRYLARLQKFVDEFGAGAARELASDEVQAVAMAGLAGRIRTLLVDDERVVPGRVDRATGAVTFGSLDDPHMDDVLDDLAELTLRMGGEVVMVPSERMPTKSGVAAIYRF